jgi:hypothetical protein
MPPSGPSRHLLRFRDEPDIDEDLSVRALVPEPGNPTQMRPNGFLRRGRAGEYSNTIVICGSNRITIFGATLRIGNVGI